MLIASLLALLSAALAVAGIAEALGPIRRRRRHGGRGLAERLMRLLAAVGRRLRPRSADAPQGLAERIAAAGAPAGLGARELLAAKLAAAIGVASLVLPLSAAAPGRLSVVLLTAGPVAGFFAPDFWLRRLAAARRRRVQRELPALLDLLRVSVEAGQSLPAALVAVGRRTDGPLARAWCATGEHVALGVPLERTLADLAARVPFPEVRTLVGALERARRHGAPLADTLTAQARDARFALARRVREEAARAGPQIQLVVALLLVPSVLLLIVAALLTALAGSGSAMLPL